MNLVGQYVKPDEWVIGNLLTEADDYSDDSFPGCEYRLPSNFYDLAVNIKITGRKSHYIEYNRYKTRIKIEFVGDGEPSTFTGGWIYSDNPLVGVLK